MSSATQQVGIESLGMLTVVVDDIDEAIEFYTGTLGFEQRADETWEYEGGEGRWVTVGVPGQDLDIAFSDPTDVQDPEVKETLESMQGALWWTFTTEDCAASVEALDAAGVEITQEPTEWPWGIEAMFEDPFGNEFSLFEYAEME